MDIYYSINTEPQSIEYLQAAIPTKQNTLLLHYKRLETGAQGIIELHKNEVEAFLKALQGNVSFDRDKLFSKFGFMKPVHLGRKTR